MRWMIGEVSMKIRSGFVSNSSSSSFIIGVNDETTKCECCGRHSTCTDDVLLFLSNNSCIDDTCCDFTTKNRDSLIEEIKDNWWLSKEEAEKMVEKIDFSKTIIIGSVSIHDNHLQDLIYNNKDIDVYCKDGHVLKNGC